MAIELILLIQQHMESFQESNVRIHDGPEVHEMHSGASSELFFQSSSSSNNIIERHVTFIVIDVGEVGAKSHLKENLKTREAVFFDELCHHINVLFIDPVEIMACCASQIECSRITDRVIPFFLSEFFQNLPAVHMGEDRLFSTELIFPVLQRLLILLRLSVGDFFLQHVFIGFHRLWVRLSIFMRIVDLEEVFIEHADGPGVHNEMADH